jgi:hypothetical protein
MGIKIRTTKRPRKTGSAPVRTKRPSSPSKPVAEPPRSRASLRAELQTLKRPVLLQKVKQALLSTRKLGKAEADKLLADYLEVILILTKTRPGSIWPASKDIFPCVFERTTFSIPAGSEFSGH